jgi:ribosomal-protein-alanine N-acetyltransferase
MELETERLMLRLLVKDDIPSFIELTNDPSLNNFSTGRFENMSEEKALGFVRENSQLYSDHKIGRFGVFLKEEEPALIGVCGLFKMSEDPFKGQVAIGYRFAGEHWGKGYAREAAAEMLRYGLQELGFHEIMALIDPSNSRSLRVAEKLKLRFKGEVVYKAKLCQRWTTWDQ